LILGEYTCHLVYKYQQQLAVVFLEEIKVRAYELHLPVYHLSVYHCVNSSENVTISVALSEW